MNKVWQIAPKIREELFRKFPEYDRVILQLLHNRGLRESEEIDLFLHGKFEDNFNPFLFNKMEEAINLTIGHIKKGDKIAQLVVCPVILSDVIEVEELPASDRGAGGFGSTGSK